MKKLLLLLAIIGACTFGMIGCGDSPQEEKEEMHEDAAEAADDADMPALEEAHEDSADMHEDHSY